MTTILALNYRREGSPDAELEEGGREGGMLIALFSTKCTVVVYASFQHGINVGVGVRVI